jgi:hypothetical protein
MERECNDPYREWEAVLRKKRNILKEEEDQSLVATE